MYHRDPGDLKLEPCFRGLWYTPGPQYHWLTSSFTDFVISIHSACHLFVSQQRLPWRVLNSSTLLITGLQLRRILGNFPTGLVARSTLFEFNCTDSIIRRLVDFQTDRRDFKDHTRFFAKIILVDFPNLLTQSTQVEFGYQTSTRPFC